jgi:hypothetical protein
VQKIAILPPAHLHVGHLILEREIERKREWVRGGRKIWKKDKDKRRKIN